MQVPIQSHMSYLELIAKWYLNNLANGKLITIAAKMTQSGSLVFGANEKLTGSSLLNLKVKLCGSLVEPCWLFRGSDLNVWGQWLTGSYWCILGSSLFGAYVNLAIILAKK